MSVSVSPAQVAGSLARFSTQATKVIALRRRQAREIAMACTRLERALHTGATFPTPGIPDPPGEQRVDVLRAEFLDAIGTYVPEALESNIVPDLDPFDDEDDSHEIGDSDYTPYNPADFGGDDAAALEEIHRLEQYLDELEKAQEAEAQFQMDTIAQALLDRKLRDEADEAKRIKALEDVGLQVAAQADRIAQNGARHAVYTKGHLDPRVIGFARRHDPQGDTYPCPFCAMLLSRQVFYKSAKTAGGLKPSGVEDIGQPDQFHPGDHCYAQEVYSREHYDTDPVFDLNREMWKLWQSKAARYQGKQALAALRAALKADQVSASQPSQEDTTP